jgi:hypothetical protein
MILFVVPAIVLILLTGQQGALRPYLGDAFGEILGWAIVAFTLFYTLFFVHLPRCRSLGLPGAALIVLFLPPLSILLGMMFLFAGEGYWQRMRHGPLAAASNSNDRNA